MSNYIPAADGEFFLWQKNFITFLDAHGLGLGVPQSIIDQCDGGQPGFENSYTNLTTVRAQAKVATEQKDTARGDLENAIRAAVKIMQASPNMSDYVRREFGLPIPKDRAPVPAPTSCPVARVETAQRLEHDVYFTDAATPTRRGKPNAAMVCEVWRAVTDQNAPTPQDPANFELIGAPGASPFTVACDPAEAGKQAYYLLRWTNRTGGNGPWSETVAATVVA